MARRMLVLIAAVLAVGVAVAAAAPPPAPKWNSGYNGWWPGGFGFPPLTVQANGYPCSLTAYGPTFHSHSQRMDAGLRRRRQLRGRSRREDDDRV